MQAHFDTTHSTGQMNSLTIGNRTGRNPVEGFMREWGPIILTAVVVPGGIVIALLMLLRRWKQSRQMTPSTVRV